MALSPAVFWYGCNMTRHGEMIGIAARLLKIVGMDAAPRGGPGHCCGSPKDANAGINEGMARRTIETFNATGRATVVTWCPSCHMNMRDSMAPVTPPGFETRHVTEVVHAGLAMLRPLLTLPLRRRVLLHAHHGFNSRVPVNRLVAEILGAVPGVEVVESELVVPGHMCSALVGVPGTLAAAQRATLEAMAAADADTLCTIHHSCHRACVPLERRGVRVLNWTQVLAESLGWGYGDRYKDLRNAVDPRAEVSEVEMARIGDVAFERLLEAELGATPPV